MPVWNRCEWCGTEFRVPPSQSHVRCCSTECGYKARSARYESCGLHNEFNLRVVPATDNLSKGNKDWLNHPDRVT